LQGVRVLHFVNQNMVVPGAHEIAYLPIAFKDCRDDIEYIIIVEVLTFLLLAFVFFANVRDCILVLEQFGVKAFKGFRKADFAVPGKRIYFAEVAGQRKHLSTATRTQHPEEAKLVLAIDNRAALAAKEIRHPVDKAHAPSVEGASLQLGSIATSQHFDAPDYFRGRSFRECEYLDAVCADSGVNEEGRPRDYSACLSRTCAGQDQDVASHVTGGCPLLGVQAIENGSAR
jgi:hypothetical protein